MSSPLVTVITPVYNGSPWLERTMECIQRQTYSNVLHVVLNNCSTDNTAEVLERYRNLRIPVSIHSNKTLLKQIDNWNAAFHLTPHETRYVMLMCADDLVRSDAIEKLVARAEEDSGIELVAAGDVAHDRVCLPHPPGGKMIIDGKEMIRAILDNSYNHYAWQCFFARWHPEEAEQDFFISGPAAFDNDRLMKVMARGRVGFVNEPLVYTRHHAQTLSRSMSSSKDPKQRLWRWEATMLYADDVFPPHTARLVKRIEKYFVVRYEVIWRLRGFTDSARALQQRLSQDGYPISALDRIASVLHYPIYKIQQSFRRRAANKGFPRRITESAFVTAPSPLSSTARS